MAYLKQIHIHASICTHHTILYDRKQAYRPSVCMMLKNRTHGWLRSGSIAYGNLSGEHKPLTAMWNRLLRCTAWTESFMTNPLSISETITNHIILGNKWNSGYHITHKYTKNIIYNTNMVTSKQCLKCDSKDQDQKDFINLKKTNNLK